MNSVEEKKEVSKLKIWSCGCIVHISECDSRLRISSCADILPVSIET